MQSRMLLIAGTLVDGSWLNDGGEVELSRTVLENSTHCPARALNFALVLAKFLTPPKIVLL